MTDREEPNQEMTERMKMEKERERLLRVVENQRQLLQLVAVNPGPAQLIKSAVTFFQEQSGCEAVGIRLKDGEDYPYYEVRGFSKEFVLLEDHLCMKDVDDSIVRDSFGNPVIECMCGNVICGRFDASKSFFTRHGSFWTNSTTELLASTTETDRQARTRNRCNGEGYESVALIPLRVGENRLGLLQLNDHRKDMFSLESIELWETLADQLAIAYSRSQVEESLLESRDDLSRAQAVARTGSWRLDTRKNELRWSDETYRLFGIPKGTPLTYETFLAAIHHEDREYVDKKWNAALRGESYDIEHRIVIGADVKWVRERAELEFDHEGQLLGGFGTVQDITQRQQVEQELREVNENLTTTIEELAVTNEELAATNEELQSTTEELHEEIEDRKRAEEEIRSLALFPDENPYPIMRVSADGTLLYANSSSEPLLKCFGHDSEPSLPNVFITVAAEALDTGIARELDVDCEDRTFSFVLAPIRDQGYVNLYGRDVTMRKLLEKTARELEAHKREFYKRTIFAATEGKLVIMEREEIEQFSCDLIGSWSVQNVPEMAVMRDEVGQLIRAEGMDDKTAYRFLGCVVEAAANAIKHAGGGQARLCRGDGNLFLGISDSGPGIEALTLPNVALLKGFSTAGTLGMGYKLMIKFADKVYLATDSSGTSVGVEMGVGSG